MPRDPRKPQFTYIPIGQDALAADSPRGQGAEATEPSRTWRAAGCCDTRTWGLRLLGGRSGLPRWLRRSSCS